MYNEEVLPKNSNYSFTWNFKGINFLLKISGWDGKASVLVHFPKKQQAELSMGKFEHTKNRVLHILWGFESRMQETLKSCVILVCIHSY